MIIALFSEGEMSPISSKFEHSTYFGYKDSQFASEYSKSHPQLTPTKNSMGVNNVRSPYKAQLIGKKNKYY
jgi:hypothetical protein